MDAILRLQFLPDLNINLRLRNGFLYQQEICDVLTYYDSRVQPQTVEECRTADRFRTVVIQILWEMCDRGLCDLARPVREYLLPFMMCVLYSIFGRLRPLTIVIDIYLLCDRSVDAARFPDSTALAVQRFGYLKRLR